MADEGFESFRARCAKGNCYDRGISHSNKNFHYSNVSGSLSLTILVLRAYPHTWIGMRFLHGFPQKWNVVYLLSTVITTKVYQIFPCIFFHPFLALLICGGHLRKISPFFCCDYMRSFQHVPCVNIQIRLQMIWAQWFKVSLLDSGLG